MDKMEAIMITAKLKQTVTIFILTLSIVQPTSAMWLAKTAISVTCTGTNWFLTVAPTLDKILNPTADLRENQEIVSNVPQPIINLVKQEAEKRGINNIRCVSGGKNHTYCTHDPSKILYIPDKYIKALSRVLQKEKLTKDEQTRLNSHRVYINHELTHMERKSQILHNRYVPIAATLATQGAATCFNWLFPLTCKSFLLKNAIKIVGGISKFYIIFTLMRLFKKYDELKADDDIPDEVELLKIAVKDHENRFEPIMKDVNWINNFPLSKLLYIKMKHKHTNKTEKK